MALTTLPSSASIDETLAVIERDGGVIIEDFLDPQATAELGKDLASAFATRSTGQDSFSGRRTRRASGLFGISDRLVDIVRQPHFNGIAQRLLCQPRKMYVEDGAFEIVPDYQIGLTQGIEIGPGEGRQSLHRDDGLWLWPHQPGGQPEARVQVMVAVSDFTKANGATMVIPGSHLWGDGRLPKIEEAVPAVMRAGSALIWIGSTYHCGGLNRTADQSRIGVTVSFDRANLRLEENHYVALGEATLLQLPEDVQRRLGLAACAPACGWVEVDGTVADPIDLLRRRHDPSQSLPVTNLAARDVASAPV